MKPLSLQVIAAFLIGGLLGGLLGARAQRSALHRLWQNGPDTERMMKKFSGELSLDEGQQDAVKAVLDKYRDKMKVLHADTKARFDGLRLAMRAEIKPLLRPDQQAKFEVMLARWDARHGRPAAAPAAPAPSSTSAAGQAQDSDDD